MKKFLTASLVFIFIFNFTSNTAAYSRIFSTVGAGPADVIVDATGNIYVANYNSDNVSKITPAGVSTILGITGSNPVSLNIDATGNIYVANYNSDNVSKITPAGVSTILGTTGSKPYSVIVDAAGNVYTANSNSDNVSKITPAGVSTIFATTGAYPSDLVMDSLGNIFTANYVDNNVSKITPAGVSTIFATIGVGTGPTNMTIDTADNIYVANYDSNTVSKITPLGVVTTIGTTGTNPDAVVVDAIGNVYTANYTSNNVSKITPAGVSTIIGVTGTTPYAIAKDSLSNNFYTANNVSNDLSKLSAPILTEVTPITTPTTDNTPDYTFNAKSDATTTVTYGGSCAPYAPVSTSILQGNNNKTITFQTMPDGTYSNCTITVTDAFSVSNTLSVSAFMVNTAPPVVASSSGGGGGTSLCTATNTTFCSMPVPAQKIATQIPTTPLTTKTYISPVDGTTQSCIPFKNYLKLNSKTNDKTEVTLWQSYLNKFHSEHLEVNGNYNNQTFAAVKRFQNKYKNEVLTPWGLKNPTGYTYKTTRAKANSLLGCSEGSILLDNGKSVNY